MWAPRGNFTSSDLTIAYPTLLPATVYGPTRRLRDSLAVVQLPFAVSRLAVASTSPDGYVVAHFAPVVFIPVLVGPFSVSSSNWLKRIRTERQCVEEWPEGHQCGGKQW
eukprot:GEMP01132327.1.p2 GENE.GEMP01132327.1~~GEMP01132327.1.p2  ORF type:complete len:109 (-),score=9.96 GEMP01132327.1:178-504(-)